MVRLRIAPTPSGYLHIANALNFVLIWLRVGEGQEEAPAGIDDRDNSRANRNHRGYIPLTGVDGGTTGMKARRRLMNSIINFAVPSDRPL